MVQQLFGAIGSQNPTKHLQPNISIIYLIDLLVQNLGSSLESPQSLTLSQNLLSGTHLPFVHVCSDIAHWDVVVVVCCWWWFCLAANASDANEIRTMNIVSRRGGGVGGSDVVNRKNSHFDVNIIEAASPPLASSSSSSSFCNVD